MSEPEDGALAARLQQLEADVQRLAADAGGSAVATLLTERVEELEAELRSLARTGAAAGAPDRVRRRQRIRYWLGVSTYALGILGPIATLVWLMWSGGVLSVERAVTTAAALAFGFGLIRQGDRLMLDENVSVQLDMAKANAKKKAGGDSPEALELVRASKDVVEVAAKAISLQKTIDR